MDTLILSRVVVDGTLLSLLLGALIIGSLLWNPRLWMQDYPEPIRARMAPLTPAEKRDRGLLTVPFLGILLVVPLVSTYLVFQANGGTLSFLTAYLHIFLLLSMFNLFDAVVIDWLFIVVMKPKAVMVPEAAGLEYTMSDRRMHLVNFLKGVAFCLVFSAPLALVALLLANWLA